MTRQDEKQRLKRRLHEYAVNLATAHQWEEAIGINQQILEINDDPIAYNRLGKAYMELGNYTESYEAYQQALLLAPTNTIARKNTTRLEALMARGIQQADRSRTMREHVDMRMFITEAGRTAITTLIDVPRNETVEGLTTGEKVELHIKGDNVVVLDINQNQIGTLEPKLAQRLRELMTGGNRYSATVAQCDTRQVQVLIRETFQHPDQRHRVSFPGKLSESTMYGYISGLRYDYEVEDMMDEEDIIEDTSDMDEEYSNGDDDHLNLDEIEKDMNDDDDE